ncbi:MAG: monovalent cation/H(+) antiporter subunit G [Hyphomicrobiaceae bacterium]
MIETLFAAAGASPPPPSGPALPASFYIDWIVHILSFAFIVAGSFFVLVGTIGMLRMPDVFTRMHAASVIDTLGAGFLIAGMILQAGPSLISLKLMFIFILFFATSPVATHALAQAALHAGERPELKEDRTAAAASGSTEPKERS